MPTGVDPGRRRALKLLGSLPLVAMAGACARQAGAWPAWRDLVSSCLSEDGRIVDHGRSDLRSTSESQSYGLFFALVANDRARFDRILQWTQNNLAAGDLRKHLPAWLWGRDGKGRWQAIDTNPASDADLWLAYALLEAARLWRRHELQALGTSVLAQARAREVANLAGLGAMLLPGPQGFVDGGTVRLNPSYLPLPLLRRFAGVDPGGPWAALAGHFLRVLQAASPLGFAPDWVAWRDGGVAVDPETGAVGSYDAIRCYLWAGMLSPRDPAHARQLQYLSGPLQRLRGGQPMWETVDTRTGQGHGVAGTGFEAALLPYLQAQGEATLAARMQAARLAAEKRSGAAPGYYAQVLGLFGAGWYEGRYRFGVDGALHPSWA